MSSPWMSQAGAFCMRWFAKAITGSSVVARFSIVASLAVAETLLDLIHSGIVVDVSTVKDSMIRKFSAEADAAEADAMKKLADAADASNRANLHKRKDRLAQIDYEQRKLGLAKTQAEISAIESDTESRRIQAMADARSRVIDSISKLRQAGGDVFLDEENLKEILGITTSVPLSQDLPALGITDVGTDSFYP
jgi:hypothetical protein